MEINPFTDEFFMKEALKEASKASQLDEVPVGAVVVCENQIIARAHNYTQTLNDVTAHAEMLAFTSAFDFLGGKSSFSETENFENDDKTENFGEKVSSVAAAAQNSEGYSSSEWASMFQEI